MEVKKQLKRAFIRRHLSKERPRARTQTDGFARGSQCAVAEQDRAACILFPGSFEKQAGVGAPVGALEHSVIKRAVTRGAERGVLRQEGWGSRGRRE